MHSYPMYTSFLDNPLDPRFVPFTCALTSALCGKPTLMEEFGGCTVPAGEPSQMWEWSRDGQAATSSSWRARTISPTTSRQTLPNLVDAGATGAMLWCYADYSEDLWDKPPLVEYKHERHFGLVRPDGSIKPHAQVIKDFAATQPTVQPPKRKVEITPDEFYADQPAALVRLWYEYVKA